MRLLFLSKIVIISPILLYDKYQFYNYYESILNLQYIYINCIYIINYVLKY